MAFETNWQVSAWLDTVTLSFVFDKYYSVMYSLSEKPWLRVMFADLLWEKKYCWVTEKVRLIRQANGTLTRLKKFISQIINKLCN